MSQATDRSQPVVRPIRSRATFRKSMDELLTSTAAAWNTSRAAIITLLVMPAVIGGIGIAAAFFGKSIYKRLTEEDQLAEMGQVGFYAASLVMSLVVARWYIRLKNHLIAFLFLILALGFVFMVGEELSWGQRILGWSTPQTFASINKQEETNLHNIYGVGSKFKWIQMLVGAYGTFLPFVALRTNWRPSVRTLLDAVVPHYSLIPYFLPMFAWRLYRNLAGDPVRYYYVITNYNEIIELILSMGFCLFLVFQLRHCRRVYSGRTASE